MFWQNITGWTTCRMGPRCWWWVSYLHFCWDSWWRWRGFRCFLLAFRWIGCTRCKASRGTHFFRGGGRRRFCRFCHTIRSMFLVEPCKESRDLSRVFVRCSCRERSFCCTFHTLPDEGDNQICQTDPYLRCWNHMRWTLGFPHICCNICAVWMPMRTPPLANWTWPWTKTDRCSASARWRWKKEQKPWYEVRCVLGRFAKRL